MNTTATKTRIVYNGELTTRRRLMLRGILYVLGGITWLTLLLAVPCVLLMALAFATRGEYGEILFYDRGEDGKLVWQLTFENFTRLAGYDIMGWSPDYLYILLRTTWFSVVTTVLSIGLAYPISFFVATRSPRWRYFWLLLIMIPFCTNLVIRIYGWELLLSQDMVFSRIAQFFHYTDPLYPSQWGILLGMVTSSLPFAILPLYTNVERLDWSLIEAARDLYASPVAIFRHAIFPQTKAGLSVAVLLTFIPCMGMFLVSDRLGGSKYMLMGNLIQQQFGQSRDFPFGAAISFGLIILSLVALLFYQRKAKGAQIL